MCGVIIVKVKGTLRTNVLPQKGLGPNVYIVGEIMPSKSVGTLNNRKWLIKLIPVNLVLGSKNEMDRDLILIIIPRKISTVDQYLCSFKDVPIGIPKMITPIGIDLHLIIKIIQGLIRTQMILGSIRFVTDAKNLVIMLTIVRVLKNLRITFLCAVTAKQQDTLQMSVHILRRIILLMIEIGKGGNE